MSLLHSIICWFGTPIITLICVFLAEEGELKEKLDTYQENIQIPLILIAMGPVGALMMIIGGLSCSYEKWKNRL
jgi:hypothetical protein